MAVVQEVAEREGVDAMELDRPLYEAIDPDALDRLVRSLGGGPSASRFSVSFAYHGYGVTVWSDGVVGLDRLESV